MSASTAERLEAALAYRRRGWALLPIRPRTKEPHAQVLDAVHGSTAWGPLAQPPASTRGPPAWFETAPETGVAITPGQPSGGLIVADFPARAPASGTRRHRSSQRRAARTFTS